MYPRASDARRIFLEAVEKHPPAEWPRFLEQATEGDLALRGFVEALLESHRESNQLLDDTGVVATIAFPPVLERPGTQIGPYKLVEEIGEGGMGVVYMAAQAEPVRRKVALKIIKPGMDTREVIARFAAEEQALAMMDHPNIAKVFDAGTTESGRPYFVMELVNGVPLTQYCDDNNATTPQRLELFVLLCHAVQHAHQKGVIHRDIKPSNILVTLHDGVPVPKIIDFGIAKAIGGGLTSETMATGYGQMVGTPLYMSPEQAERSGLDIDTRSDIYSLGVLLYELLTGSMPFDREQLKDAGLDEVRRLIREQEPPRPSTRISTMGMAATTVSEHRRTNPVELSNSLRHELDWIVMKALEKDRTRRYETANDFARDIQRYLHDEAVEACPPSTVYRLRKFTRRHQTAAIATAAVSLALILGAGVAAGQAYRATKAETVAEEQLHIAQEQQRLAKEQAQLAQKQKKLAEEAAQRERDLRTEAEAARKQSEAVTNFLVDIFRSPDPERDGRTITVAEMLDKAKTRVETEFKDDQLLKAKLLKAIGGTYLGRGLVQDTVELTKKSYDMLRDVLGPQHPDTLAAMQSLTDAYLAAGHLDGALSLAEETWRLRKEVLGPEHPDTLTSMGNLAEAYGDAGRLNEALRLGEQTLQLRKKVLGPEHVDTLKSMNDLAVTYTDTNRWNEALRLNEEAVRLGREKLGPEHPLTLIMLSNLASAYLDAGRWQEATELEERVLQIWKDKLGPEHPNTLTAMGNVAAFYWKWGKLDRSIPLFEETLRLKSKVLGENHPATLHNMANLGVNYYSAGQLDKAVSLLEEALRKCQEKLGAERPETLFCMLSLGSVYVDVGRWEEGLRLLDETLRLQKNLGSDRADELSCLSALAGAYLRSGRADRALPLFEEVFRLRKEKLGPEHHATLSAMSNVATAYWRQGKLDQSIPLFEEAFRIRKISSGVDHPSTLAVMTHLGRNYTDAGRLAEALRLLEESLALCKEKLGPAHLTTLMCMVDLASALRRVGRLDEALKLLEAALPLCKQSQGPEHADTLGAMNNLALARAEAGQLDQAVALMDETVKSRKKTLGPEHPDTLASIISLGDIQVQRGEFAAAEPLLLEAYQGFAKRQAAGSTPLDNQQVQEALTNLVQLYEKSNQPDKATMLVKEVRQSSSPDSPVLAGLMAHVSKVLLHVNAFADAELMLRECLAIREKTEPDDWRTFNTKSMLGGAVLGQAKPLQATDAAAAAAKLTEAEPLLVQGYEGMQQREDKIPPEGKIRLNEALYRLVDLYTASGKPDEAAKWQQKLDALKDAAKPESKEK